MNTENRKCRNCEYCQLRSHDGICHIRPPQVVITINVKGVGMPKTAWPIVQKDDWCGEFEQKSENPPQEAIDMMSKTISEN